MAVSPIDGRYRKQVEDLSLYFSEYALIKYRVRVEIEYFIALCELPLEQLKSFDKANFEALRNIYMNFSAEDAQKVKEIEKVTNHDVKAVEYFIKDRFKEMNILNILIVDCLMVGTDVEGRFQSLGMTHKLIL